MIEDDTPPPSSSSASSTSSHHRRLVPGSGGGSNKHYHSRSSNNNHHIPPYQEPSSRSHAMPPPPLTSGHGGGGGLHGPPNGYHNHHQHHPSSGSAAMVPLHESSVSGRLSKRSNKRLPSTDLILVGHGSSYVYPYQYPAAPLYLPTPSLQDPHYYGYSGSSHHYPPHPHSHPYHYGSYYHHPAEYAYSEVDYGLFSGLGTATMTSASRKRRKSNSDKYIGPPSSSHGYPIYYHHPPVHGPSVPFAATGPTREALPSISPWDDKEGHYIVNVGDDLTPRYKIIRLLGQGTFGKVVECLDRETQRLCAIKIIRAVQKYRDASKIEIRVLDTLKRHDPRNSNKCLHLNDCFDFRNHVCMVFDLLGQSIYDWLKDNSFCPFPPNQIQLFARQLFSSVAFLHRLRLIHTDLKPENILLANGSYRTAPYKSLSKTRRILLDPEIRLIDFGSATFEDEHHSTVVCTRHYRAPEIILGLGWSYPCDIWSIGCILVEFLTGEALFQTHDNLEHLAMMQAVLGPIPEKLIRESTKSAQKYFVHGRLDYPNDETKRNSKRYVKALRPLRDYVIPPNCSGETEAFAYEFLDLLKGLLSYDPATRITASEALGHPYFNFVVEEDGHVTNVKKYSSSSTNGASPYMTPA